MSSTIRTLITQISTRPACPLQLAHALRPARRAQRVLAGPVVEHRGLQAATNIPAVHGEPEPRGRHLLIGELRSLFQACSPSSDDGGHQDSTSRRRHDAAFLALACSARVDEPGPLVCSSP
jgi:hypothetical protein